MTQENQKDVLPSQINIKKMQLSVNKHDVLVNTILFYDIACTLVGVPPLFSKTSL